MINDKNINILRKELEKAPTLHDMPNYNDLINQVTEAAGPFEGYAKKFGY